MKWLNTYYLPKKCYFACNILEFKIKNTSEVKVLIKANFTGGNSAVEKTTGIQLHSPLSSIFFCWKLFCAA